MISMLKKAGLLVCMTSGLAGFAWAELAPDFMEKLESEDRPLEDRMRDSARRPYQVMQLLGVDAGMTAVDIGAGGGWYTRVLSAAVGPEGTVIAQFGPRAAQNNNGQAQRDMAEQLGNVEPSFENLGDLDSGIADVAVTALNMHHFNDEVGRNYMTEVYDVLKPGGRAAIIDHEGSTGMQNGRMHRMLASDARAWIEAAGFEIVEESDLLHTNADDHTMSATAPELGRNSDRFLFIVEKPE